MLLSSPLGRAALLGRHTPKPYLGQVGTNCRISQLRSAANINQMMSRSAHFFREPISALTFGFANSMVDVSQNGIEVDGGAIETLAASVEHPAGTFKQFLWGGAATTAVAAGALAISDPLPISITDGFARIRIWRAAAGGLMVFSTDTSTALRNTTLGEAFTYAASGLTNQTMSGTITDAGTQAYMTFPTLLLADTVKPSLAGLGNSRMFGRTDSFDASGDMGNTMRAIGPLFGYCNMGVSQDRLAWYLANHARRNALLKYFSHAITEYSTNDIFVDLRTAAQVEADLVTAYPLVRGLLASPAKVGQNTIEPASTSQANTTPATNSSERLLLNDAIRAGLGQDFTSDLAALAQSQSNNQLWSNSSWVDFGGLHANRAGNLVISQGVNTSAIRR
jgi:hypothetical protein